MVLFDELTVSSKAPSMGIPMGDMSGAIPSGSLHQKQAFDTEYGEPDEEEKAASSRTCGKIANCLLESNQERTPHVVPKKELDTSWQKQNPKSGNQAPQLNQSSLTVKREPVDLHERQSSDAGHDVSDPNEQERTESCTIVQDSEKPSADPDVAAQESYQNHVFRITVLEKALKKLQQRHNIDNRGFSSQLAQESIISNAPKNPPIIPKNEPESNDFLPNHCLDDGNCELVREGEKYTNIKMENVSGNQPHIGSLSVEVPISEFDHQKFRNKAEKLPPGRNPDPSVEMSQLNSECIPAKLLEKGLDDGYNWRKYGQKFLKRNVHIRSYYRCTYPICQAKKQVERLHDGYITDVNYFGEHQHPKTQKRPQVASGFQVRTREIPILTVSNADAELIIARADLHQHIEVTDVVSQANGGSSDKDDCPNSKRQKREINVAETSSDVDVVNDGYRWRKYGQKFVKGNPNPRSYYRCSTAGCPAKKHVERAPNDPKLVITAYEGQHDHDVPPCRTKNQNTIEESRGN